MSTEEERATYRERSKKQYHSNPQKALEKCRRYRNANPWNVSLQRARRRCNNPKQRGFKNYGGAGIQCLITNDEVKELWFRDHASLLLQPSLDRKDSKGHYTFDNCRFVEFRVNQLEGMRSAHIAAKTVCPMCHRKMENHVGKP